MADMEDLEQDLHALSVSHLPEVEETRADSAYKGWQVPGFGVWLHRTGRDLDYALQPKPGTGIALVLRANCKMLCVDYDGWRYTWRQERAETDDADWKGPEAIGGLQDAVGLVCSLARTILRKHYYVSVVRI